MSEMAIFRQLIEQIAAHWARCDVDSFRPKSGWFASHRSAYQTSPNPGQGRDLDPPRYQPVRDRSERSYHAVRVT
jgi:hypothetical protein